MAHGLAGSVQFVRLVRTVLAVGTGLLFLFTGPASTRAQSPPLAPTPIPNRTPPAPRAKKAQTGTDIFAGLQYSEDQKVKINKIQQDTKSRMDAVAKDDKLGPEQKDAFIQGYQRMERIAIYNELTAEQKKEVSKRMAAQREEAQKEKDKKKLRQPPPG